jgi:gliding motility-associated-like protein
MVRNISILFSLIFFLWANECRSQCTALGQNPGTAFPVCGITVFNQVTVPICSSNSLYVPGCSGTGSASYQNKNPYWYKFTCYQTGTLGFLITPNNSGDDYDWQLYDVTGHNPDEVYTNAGLVVTGNWAGTYGATGASAGGVGYIQCASDPRDNAPSFAKMPTLIVGHNYILLVSHFTNSQSGYALSFGGGTAVITDPLDPHLKDATAICDGTSAMIHLNKRMKCSSLLSNGSEFTISPPAANTIAASAIGCSSGFDFDSVRLTFDAPLPPGNYTITIHTGSDANTLVDNCDKLVPDGENIPMIVYPLIPTPMDSISKVGCAPDVLHLVFRKGMFCNSIAPDGSDFVVTGTTPVTVIGATGNCDGDGLARIINVQLSAPIQTKGSYTITLMNGTDGNTLRDECNQQTPAGSALNFATKDTVNADFSFTVHLGCKSDTVDYVHDGRNEVNNWKWNFDNLRKSTLQNPRILYASFGPKQTQLIVSNGVCTDTSAMVPVILGNELKSIFEATAVICPNDLATFKDKSIGQGLSWFWEFGNGITSNVQDPPKQTYIPFSFTRDVTASLVVTNNLGCKDTGYQKIKVPNHCYIAVPNAFTPNGDGLNDYLYPVNAYKAVNLLFRVYNRFGQLLFETQDWQRKWDGTFKGQGADPGTYVWTLQYINTDTGKFIEQKGTSILIR